MSTAIYTHLLRIYSASPRLLIMPQCLPILSWLFHCSSRFSLVYLTQIASHWRAEVNGLVAVVRAKPIGILHTHSHFAFCINFSISMALESFSKHSATSWFDQVAPNRNPAEFNTEKNKQKRCNLQQNLLSLGREVCRCSWLRDESYKIRVVKMNLLRHKKKD